MIENVRNTKVGKHTGEAGFEPSRPKATEVFIQHPQPTKNKKMYSYMEEYRLQ